MQYHQSGWRQLIKLLKHGRNEEDNQSNHGSAVIGRLLQRDVAGTVGEI